MNKPKDDTQKKLDEVLTRFLSNNSDEAALEQEQAEFDDIEVDADKDK